MDKRRFKRVQMTHPVKFLAAGNIECTGTLLSISAGDMSIFSNQAIGVGDRIVAYVQGVDRFEGVVRRKMGQIFAIKLHISDARREKLIDILTLELAKQSGIISDKDIELERRGSRRTKGMSQFSLCTLENGVSVRCSVIDMSMTGVAIEMDPVLAVGDIVQIGRMKARVVREMNKGYGLEILATSNGLNPTQASSYKSAKENAFDSLEVLKKAYSKKPSDLFPSGVFPSPKDEMAH